MNAVIKLDATEFNQEFFQRIQTLLKGMENFEITIVLQQKNVEGFLRHETREDYGNRLFRALKNMEEGKNITSYSEEEFNAFSQQLLNEP